MYRSSLLRLVSSNDRFRVLMYNKRFIQYLQSSKIKILPEPRSEFRSLTATKSIISEPLPFGSVMAMLSHIQIRGIKTTNKKEDPHVEVYDPEYIQQKKPKGPETAQEFADVSSQKNWISFGFDRVDQKEDRHLANAYFFSLFTLCCIVFSWIIYYYPHPDGMDWAIREAFLELDRRERLGLPLIDPNLVPPEKVTLPSEEELAKLDFEIHL